MRLRRAYRGLWWRAAAVGFDSWGSACRRPRLIGAHARLARCRGLSSHPVNPGDVCIAGRQRAHRAIKIIPKCGRHRQQTLYVTTKGDYLFQKRGECVRITADGLAKRDRSDSWCRTASSPSPVSISRPYWVLRRNVGYYHWFSVSHGRSFRPLQREPVSGKNVLLRRTQYRAAGTPIRPPRVGAQHRRRGKVLNISALFASRSSGSRRHDGPEVRIAPHQLWPTRHGP